jgi:hypothetical protein
MCTDATKEQFVLHYLALIDMERAIRSLEYLETVTDVHIREALFRDAVICYAKPFSGNRSISGNRKLRVSESFVPPELSASHTEVLGLRHQLFAHMDLDRQAPNVSLEEQDGERHMSFSVVGYERVLTDHLLAPLRELARIAQSFLHQKLKEIESNA